MKYSCLALLCLLACTASQEVKPHTEVTSDLMWVVNDGRVVTITCRDAQKTETTKITANAFLKERKGITLTLLDIAVGVVGWFLDLEK